MNLYRSFYGNIFYADFIYTRESIVEIRFSSYFVVEVVFSLVEKGQGKTVMEFLTSSFDIFCTELDLNLSIAD